MVTAAATPPVPGAHATPWSGKVALIAKPGGTSTGVGRYVEMLHRGLRDAGVEAARIAPSVPPLPGAGYAVLERLGVDLRAFLANYPIWAAYPRADLYHLTSQNLATLLLFRRPPGRVVVTVHDIIPYMLRDDPMLCPYRTAADRIFDRLAMAGLRRADLLLADSHYTRACLERHLGIDRARIAVVHLGIDAGRFRPLPVPAAFRARYNLPDDRRYLIYVGSEDPRKNLPALLRALAGVRRELPEVELIKVGRAHFEGERSRLLDLAASLRIRAAVRFLDDVPDEDLPLLYNAADVCVIPSLYEGFGFPVLEALACGTPVIATHAASLPELLGDGGLLVKPGPDAPSLLAYAIVRVLTDHDLSLALRRAAPRRAAEFSWGATTRDTLGQYRLVQAPPAGGQSRPTSGSK